MNKEEILNKYIDLIDKGYCSDCNELNCIDNFPHTKITRAIRKLQQENKELKEKYVNAVADYEKTMFEKEQLKKQLEEWKQHLKYSKEMLDIQGQKGNYDYDEYMLGLYNGMEYIISLFETREPNYISGKDIKFINNKSQQKEFILYLENEIYSIEPKGTGINYNCEYDSEEDYISAMKEQSKLNTLKEILSKYKSIIGVSDENTIK